MIARLKLWIVRRLVTRHGEELLTRGRILTAEQQTLLDADRKTVLRAMLSPEQWRLVEALETPLRLKDQEKFTKQDADGLEQLLKSPLGLKLDAAMNNWLLDTAQAALGAPTAEIVAHAKFAWGCRAGWEMAKTISRHAAADCSAEEGETTGSPDLEHLNP